ncbi:MAG: NGG1p interacting factor NIF3 [Sphaerochaetaceae bacterium]|jgi:hypothetical protein|nr:NGG1p interacting factor NIF3 [Sphaerochaetaceae bacterium]NLO60201.1 NGG1p interacting factor NIF3 [Spirochaetales bacterium]MDD2404856.1 NGG1p interacting factor NIF3 [Sphaerochaetaceae bacterium]MDD3671782.1 NGG1p interacting factor NIF3 [Sphaerochaetaceae bacterium]MDD4258456.1 NGG1p interacting factor NIF3 [Sphaerochaetaceae bacterium]
MYVLVWYVPESHLEKTKDAVFASGGGKMGDYERCSWQCIGKGQFLPNQGSSPFIGRVGELETVDEYRVEVAVTEENATEAVHALLKAHPYETCAYHLIPVLTIEYDRSN